VTSARPTLSGIFLSGTGGPLAAVAWGPPVGTVPAFAALYVPPFGDEMNRSRRMAAQQARALAMMGGLVLLLDLRGTGDSGGDHGDASWGGWKDDVTEAWSWLSARVDGPCVLWGLRLGGLLAADAVAEGRLAPAALLLWQPTHSGRAFFNQYLRLATIQSRIGEAGRSGDANGLRATLAANSPVEVAGYELGPSLVAGADQSDLAKQQAPSCPVIWREVTPAATSSLSPATQSLKQRWTTLGTHVDAAIVEGPSFWATQEIAEAPELVADTTVSVSEHLRI